MDDVLKQLKAPAIGLIITGTINFGLAILTLLSGLFRLSGIIPEGPLPANDAERMGYYIGTIIPYSIALLSLILSPVTFFGGIKLLSGKNLTLAKAGAVLAILPVTSCCFPVGAVFGIWAFVVLTRPEVKAFLSGTQFGRPPMPPQNWGT